jgi:LysM repeat protein
MAREPETIATRKLRQLLDLDVAYTGYVDDGFGTTVRISDMTLEVDTHLEKGIFQYSKLITVTIDQMTHRVQPGDNLSTIARRMGVSVDDILQQNNITTPDLIHPGDVIRMEGEIRMGHAVREEIDISAAMNPQNGVFDIDKVRKILGEVNELVGSTANTLANHAGKTRLGRNFIYYVEKANGRVFHGNQHLKTYGLSNMGKVAGKASLGVSVIIEGSEIGEAAIKDGWKFGNNARRETFGAGGSIAGGIAGAWMGAQIGATIGATFGGIGAVPGAVIGCFIGGLIGGMSGGEAGEDAAEYLHDAIFIQPREVILETHTETHSTL